MAYGMEESKKHENTESKEVEKKEHVLDKKEIFKKAAQRIKHEVSNDGGIKA